MKNRVKKLCLWVLVIFGVFGGVIGCVLGTENAWASPIRYTVKNGDSFIVVENNITNNNNQGIVMTVKKDDGSGNYGNTIYVQPSNPNVYELDSGNSSGGSNNSGGGSSSSKEGLKCDDIADEGVDGKVGAMQWLMCPAMDNTSHAATFLDETVQDLLEVKKDIYSGEVINNAWGLVRNIANTVMIIFLMLVVISQLTGYGIDNYGIKKMLPRLITMAIVINLSLYICQIAVDLSNILGEGLRDMFGSIGDTVSGGQAEGGSFIVGSIGAMFTAAGSAGSAAIGVISTASALGLSVTAFWAVLIVVILLVLVIVVAVIVLFAMIAARKIIVIFCVVISPLAFAAFILPNTQNLFKKWWELFKVALLIFPICGAVAGIAAMLKGIARGSGALNWFEIAVVMVLPYIVYFLIPMLLKQAIAAFGKIGGAFTSVGTTLRNSGRSIGAAATQGVKNGEWGKRNMEQAARRRQERWAENYTRRHGNGEDLSKRIEAAKLRVNHTDPNTSEGRRARRGLASLQRQALLANEAQQIQNRNTIEQEMADIGGVIPVDRDAIHARAVSNRESQEIKNYTDQYSGYTRAQMGSELSNAITAYNSDRSDANATRLQAAIAEAGKRGMDKEMMQHLGGLSLSNTGNDAKILSIMAGSTNKVVSQYGKKQSANDTGALSMDNFIRGTNSNVNMATAFKNKGANYAVGMDEDTLAHVLNTNAGALSTEQLVKAAGGTSNEKELASINSMLKGRAGDYEMSVSDLSNLKLNTVNAMNPSLYSRAVNELRDPANTDAARILGSMDQDVRQKLGLENISRNQNAGNGTFQDGAGI